MIGNPFVTESQDTQPHSQLHGCPARQCLPPVQDSLAGCCGGCSVLLLASQPGCVVHNLATHSGRVQNMICAVEHLQSTHGMRLPPHVMSTRCNSECSSSWRCHIPASQFPLHAMLNNYDMVKPVTCISCATPAGWNIRDNDRPPARYT